MTDDELRDHFSRIDQRFDQIDHRFDGMQAQIDERFDGVYEVLKAQGNAIARLDARVPGGPSRRHVPRKVASDEEATRLRRRASYAGPEEIECRRRTPLTTDPLSA